MCEFSHGVGPQGWTTYAQSIMFKIQAEKTGLILLIVDKAACW